MNLANKISIFRILLLPFFVASLVYYTPEKDYLRYVALGIFLLAVITDSVDGYLARTRKEWSKLGSFLDPIADKLLLLTAFISLSFIKALPEGVRIPPWVLIVVISRDVILLIGTAVIYVINGDIEIKPSRLGKVTTFFQMLTIICLLLYLPFSWVIWGIMVLCTIASGLGYIIKGNRLLNTSTLQHAR